MAKSKKATKRQPTTQTEQTVRVALYSRISTDEANQPHSLGAQDDRLRSYVKSQENWTVWQTYQDQMTGTVLERPGLQAALADARRGLFDLLLVFRVDRLARSVRSLAAIIEELDGLDVSFRSATEPFDTSTPAGRMMVQMLGVFAEFERATLIERITAGLARKASQGFWNGKAPFGYEYGDEVGCLKVSPDEAATVTKIFDLYVAQEFGCATIARWLNENGYRNRLGNLWRQQAVRDIVAHMQKEEKRQPKRESELRRLENDSQKVRSQIDRYLSAFEEGTMPPEACAPRLQELHARQTDI